MKPLVSLVILTHNRVEATRWCLRGLIRTAYDPVEVIFVDNGSTDDSLPLLRRFASSRGRGLTCRVIENGANVGCSTARNQGAAAATGDILVFMDNDVVVRSTRWIEILLAVLEDETVGAASPKLVYPFPPYAIQFAGGAVSPSGRVHFLGRGEARTTPAYNEPRDLQCTISACMGMRRGTFAESGGFDEAYNPVQYEDVDLCYRLRHDGYRIRYVPQAEMYHFEGSTTQGSPDVRGTYQIVRNGMLFKTRWRFMFSEERGPDASEFVWMDIDVPNPSAVQDLPVVG